MTSLLQARWLERQERNWLAECAVSTCAGFGDSQSFAVDEHEPPVWLPTPVVGAPYVREPRGRLPVAGFLANFRYAPNRLALESLLRSWLPGLQRQGWKLLVAGLGSDELELPAGATCAGQIEEVDEFYDAVGVTLAPVDRGGGMKVKVAESFAYGVPVIASPAALDGFPRHVRRFAVEVDSDRDLPMLSSLHESVIPSEIRDLFTPESFARTLDRLLVSHGMGGD